MHINIQTVAAFYLADAMVHYYLLLQTESVLEVISLYVIFISLFFKGVMH